MTPTPNAAMQEVLLRLQELRQGQPNRYTLPFPESRAQLLRERQFWLDDGPVCRVDTRHVESGGRAFDVHVVSPDQIDDQRLLIYLHGGGWCVGSDATHDNIVRRLAHEMCCETWSVDYALAPEAPFPAGLLDCIEAIELAQRSHPAARVIVAGDSAGANLALAAALWLRDRGLPMPAALLLFYGVYTDDCGGASMAAYGDGRYGLSIQAHQRYLDAYLGDFADANMQTQQGETSPTPHPKLTLPLRFNTDLRHLPPIWLLAAQIDILRDQSHQMAAALRLAGNEVRIEEMPGVIHGFLSYGKVLPEVGLAMAAAATFAKGQD